MPVSVYPRVVVDAEQVLEYWFGTSSDESAVIEEKSELWWGRSAELDRECAERFGETIEAACAAELDDWAEGPRGRLAVILLLDQMLRQTRRGSAAAFAGDAAARRLAAAGIERRHDIDLRYIERVFFYLPFEHSEDLEDQERSVELFRGLLTAVPAALEEAFAQYLDYAIAHRDVIERFGRFPHRNEVLGRESTDEERAYLAQPDAGF